MGRRPTVKNSSSRSELELHQEVRTRIAAGGKSPELRMKRSLVATPSKTMCLNRLCLFS